MLNGYACDHLNLAASMRLFPPATAFVLLIAFSGSGVAAQAQNMQRPRVPEVAPDTLPRGLFADSMWLERSPCITVRVHRSVLVVTFVVGTPRIAKQAAIDSVNGVVVGGLGPVFGEGWYYVRIPADTSGSSVCDAVERLNQFPQVGYASEVICCASTFRQQPAVRRRVDAENMWLGASFRRTNRRR